jgi:cytochrome subunit of sulfide dehydrogenase
MRRMIRFTLLVALVLSPPLVADDIQAVVGECEACHGPGGVSADPEVPSLAGKSAAYIREVLEQFYYYERHCTTTTYRYGDRPKTPQNMCNVANSLSEEDKEAIAEYFADQ